MSQEVYGVPPNHQVVEWTGMAINRFENGRIVERWFNSDEMGMMRGMGLMPSGGGAAAPAGSDHPAAEPQQQTSMAVESPVGAQVSDPQLEANKAIVRRFYEYVFNEVHTEALKEVMHEDFTDHGEALFGSPHGRSMLEGGIAGFRAMFPNAGVTLQDMIAEGDMVGVRGVMHLKHDAPWLGREATGQMLTWNGLSMFRIKDGKIIDRFFNSDSLYILEQLGYWPVK
jgi:predicted ester cyclase